MNLISSLQQLLIFSIYLLLHWSYQHLHLLRILVWFRSLVFLYYLFLKVMNLFLKFDVNFLETCYLSEESLFLFFEDLSVQLFVLQLCLFLVEVMWELFQVVLNLVEYGFFISPPFYFSRNVVFIVLVFDLFGYLLTESINHLIQLLNLLAFVLKLSLHLLDELVHLLRIFFLLGCMWRLYIALSASLIFLELNIVLESMYFLL